MRLRRSGWFWTSFSTAHDAIGSLNTKVSPADFTKGEGCGRCGTEDIQPDSAMTTPASNSGSPQNSHRHHYRFRDPRTVVLSGL